jgi:hypothetical protein
MSTITDIATWAATDYLGRPELLTWATGAAKAVYLLICGRVPFDQLMVTSDERPISSTDVVHDLTDLPIGHIISVRATDGTGRWWRLVRKHVRLFDAMRPVTRATGPSMYARWGNALEFDALASGPGLTYRLRYSAKPTFAIPVGNTVLQVPEEWEELLKWETLYRCYTKLEEHDKAMMLRAPSLMPKQAGVRQPVSLEQGIIPALWNDLLRTTSQREAPDDDWGMSPRVQQYTAR